MGNSIQTQPRVSLIVTTYNRVDALAIVLNSVTNQLVPPFEILVADDGSGKDTTDFLNSITLPCPLRHIWQEDKGFRAATIRNRASLAAGGDYIVFLDGDCVLRPDFISRHIQLAEQGWLVAGNRLLLSKPFTERVLSRGIPGHRMGIVNALRAKFRGDVNRLAPLLTLPDGYWRHRHPNRWQGVRTCNLGVWRDDFERVNGFDEHYNGWGYEDSDLAIRLIRAGVGHKDGRFATGVLHLWHPENDRSKEQNNFDRLQSSLASNHVQARQGLREFIAPPTTTQDDDINST